MRVAVTGSTGLIGKALMQGLRSRGHDALSVHRQGDRFEPEHLESADAVVHLAGESIGGKLRWDESHKQRVRRSRVHGTEQIAELLANRTERPEVFISASAVGYYGNDRGDELLDENSSSGKGFLAEVCRVWESSTEAAEAVGIRVVRIRTGIVLSIKGGILPRLITPGKLGLGATLGSGNQWTSWISLEDEVRAICFALEAPQVRGALNLVAPNPVTNAELTKTIGRVLHRPAVLKVPAIALRLALGREAAEETVLASQRVKPAALEDAGFEFSDPDLEAALDRILGS